MHAVELNHRRGSRPGPAALDLVALSRRGLLEADLLTQPGERYAEVMALWERLHTPFVMAADAEADPIRKMEGYRTAIRVDYASELAHQKLSDTARLMMR